MTEPILNKSNKGGKEGALEYGELYRTLIENVSDGIYTLDAEGKLTSVNEVIVKRLGYPREWFIGRRYLDLIRPEDRQRVEAIFNAVKRGKETPPFETGYPSASGEMIWIESTVNLLWNNDELVGFLCISRDITGRERAKEALRESDRRYQALFGVANEGILIVDIGTEKFLYANSAISRILGYSVEELTQMGLNDITTIEDREFAQSEFRAIARGEKLFASGVPCLTRDQKILFMDIAASMIEFKGKICLGGLFKDITEYKLAEEALCISEEHYRGLIEGLREAVYRISIPDGRYEYMSQSARDVFGYPSEAFLSTPCFLANFIHHDFAEQWNCLMKGKLLPVCEYVIIDPHGEERWILQSNNAILDSEGNIVAIEGICRDITERKATEKALRESEERYRTLAESSQDLIFVIGVDDRIEYVNSAAANLIQKPKEEIIGRLRSMLFPSDLSQRQRRSLHHVFKTGKPCHIEGQIEVNGTIRWFDHLLVPIEDAYSRVSSVLGISRDITELIIAKESLALASRKLNLLSSITCHDIFNQLFALRGYFELSHGMLFDPQALQELLQKEIKITANIEHEIAFMRNYQEMGVKSAAWQNVKEDIDRAIAALPMRNIKVVTDRPDLEVYADPLLEKVFYILVENALRYGGNRMKNIRFLSEESDANLTILCEDDGSGISSEDKKRLFERGFGRNGGLGLFLSREILGITGITIKETGTFGKGARFEITVPKGAYRFS